MNHFELFALPVQFDIDLKALSERFRTLQAQFHPDKAATLPERDRLLMVQKSAEINDAYQTLRSPIGRAEYLLLLNGLDICHEQSTINDVDFLMQQMSLREQLEDAQAHRDPELILNQVEAEADSLYANALQRLTNDIEEQAWQQAAQVIRQLKFLVKLRQEVEQLAEKLLD